MPEPHKTPAAPRDTVVQPLRVVTRRLLVNGAASVCGRELRPSNRAVAAPGPIGAPRAWRDTVWLALPPVAGMPVRSNQQILHTLPSTVSEDLSLVTRLPPPTILLIDEYAEKRLGTRAVQAIAALPRQHPRVAVSEASPTQAHVLTI